MSVKFRRDQPQLSDEERELVDRIKRLAEELHDSIDMAPPSPARGSCGAGWIPPPPRWRACGFARCSPPLSRRKKWTAC